MLFVRDGNAYAITLTTGLEHQLTDIRPANTVVSGRIAPISTQRGALERDQRELFDVIRDQVRIDSLRRADVAARTPVGAKTFTLLSGERVGQITVSPSGNAVLFTTTTAAPESRAGIVPNYVTSSGFTEDIPNRTKVGDVQNVSRIGFQSLPRVAPRGLVR